MNELITGLWLKASEVKTNGSWEDQVAFLDRFAQLIVDECCHKLLIMHDKTNGNHKYYKHAAIEIAQHFRGEE